MVGNKRAAFIKLAESLDRTKLIFTEHFKIRKAVRGIGEGTKEELIFDRPKDLVYVQEDESKYGKQRFKAFYDLSRKKALLVVIDVETEGSFNIVSFLQYDKKYQLEMMQNARKYSKLANRLRH